MNTTAFDILPLG